MSNITYASQILPFSGANVALNGVEIDATLPTTGQILVATSPTTAQWSDPNTVSSSVAFILNVNDPNLPNARALMASGGITKTTPGSTVQLDLDTQPSITPGTFNDVSITVDATGEISQITSNSEFTENKAPCRVATTAPGTLASDFENGDTIDGITLATGDRILIKNQASAIENGIYIVQATGAPSRDVNLPTGNSANGVFCSVNEGNINANQVFVCVSPPGSDVVDTDDLLFRQLWGSGTTAIQVSSIGEFTQAIIDGFTEIILGSSQYTFSTSITIPGGTIIRGYGFSSVFNYTATTGSAFVLGGDNITLENVSFNLSNVNTIAINASINTPDNVNIRECRFTGRAFITANTNTGLYIDSCFINSTLGTGTNPPMVILNGTDIYFQNSIYRGLSASGEIQFGTCNRVFVNGLHVSDGRMVFGTTTNATIDSCNFSGDVSFVVNSNSSDIQIVNNRFANGLGASNDIDLNTTNRVKISGNTIGGDENNPAVSAVSSPNTIIRGNVIFSGATNKINIQANCNNSLIEANSFVNPGDIAVNSTGNDLLAVLANSNTRTFTDPTGLTAYYDNVLVNKTIDPLPNFALDDPTLGSANRTLHIIFNNNTVGTATFTITATIAGGNTQFTFSGGIGSYIVIRWNGREWEVLENNGVVVS